MKTLGFILMVLFALAMSFGITTLIVYGICWTLGFVFTWKLAIGAWLIITILQSIFKQSK